MKQAETGKKAWRNDAYSKVTGQAEYCDDLKVHGMAHAVPVYSSEVHAEIISIETEEARSFPGVLSVITAGDIPGEIRYGQIYKDYHMLADDRIRFNGDVIAIVVAQKREQAVAAAKLVRLNAKPLPPLLDPEEALKDGASLVHEDHIFEGKSCNITNHHKIRRGNVSAAFKECDFVIERKFNTQYIEHSYLEPESGLCIPRYDGVMEVMGSMQHPFSTRRFVAAILGAKLSDVEVRSVAVGGGFGGKDDTAALVCARAALAAKILNKPVKMTYDREWSFRESYKRHPYIIYYKMGIKNGKIHAAEVKIIADSGAYCSVTPWVTWRSTVQCCGPYEVEHVHCDTYGVYTNNVFTGAMRGFGSPQLNFAIEQLVDIAAEKLGISPVEFRKQNMLRQGSTTITGQVLDTHTVSLDQVFEETLKRMDYESKLAKCSRGRADENSDELYGTGLALSYRGMSLGAEGMDFNSAIINVQPDGSILLEAAIHENGQGAESAFILIAAGELGTSVDRIRYRQPSTSNIPDGGTTVASRGTIMGGGAVVTATRELKRKLAMALCCRLSCNPGDIRFFNDRIYGKTDDVFLTYEQAVHEMYLQQEIPYAFGVFKAPKVSWDEETGKGNAYFTWVYGCQAVELTVNRKTGKVKLLNMTAAHEVGRAINMPMILGQIYGGMAMGAGYGLMEEVKVKDGIIQNTNFNTYKIPRAADLPEMQAIVIENGDPLSPSGAKGIGEPANELMAPAIANAVYNATGIRYYSSPLKITVENENNNK
ncbi:MAG: xanthine dehydrogenase family protein molybdopterin-binding subunit [Firmicutes bacterium]|nr:xanthine dehydrogenase family protein molybdopterin-binding subunit [Bacillota bacterium]